MIDHRTVKALVKKPTARQRKAAELLAHSDKTIHGAMLEAGYSSHMAVRGIAGIPKTVLALMPQESNLVDLGRALNPEQQEALVRGRLALNVLKGKDSGVVSAYRLGQDKRVNMFTPENQTGVVVLNVNALPEKDGKVPENE